MKEDGGPAFPIAGVTLPNGEFQWPWSGASLRDYFAAHALQAVNVQAHVAEPAAEFIAWSVYNIADAMLAERSKP
jgi:hypothetical protein